MCRNYRIFSEKNRDIFHPRVARVLCAEPLGDIQFALVELSTELDFESW